MKNLNKKLSLAVGNRMLPKRWRNKFINLMEKKMPNIDELFKKYSVYWEDKEMRAMNFKCFTQAIAEIISHPLEADVGLPERNSFGQWISTTDDLPEAVEFPKTGREVILLIDNEVSGGWQLNKKDNELFWYREEDCWVKATDDIKWMPLPKP